MTEPEQGALFDLTPEWRREWEGMPAYEQEDVTPYRSLIVHFDNAQDLAEFSRLLGQEVSPRAKFIWHPTLEREQFHDKRWVRP